MDFSRVKSFGAVKKIEYENGQALWRKLVSKMEYKFFAKHIPTGAGYAKPTVYGHSVPRNQILPASSPIDVTGNGRVVADNAIAADANEVKFYGKTLKMCQLLKLDSEYTHRGITYTPNADGSITVNGTASSGTSWVKLNKSSLKLNNKYLMMLNAKDNSVLLWNDGRPYYSIFTSEIMTVTQVGNIFLRVEDGTTIDNAKVYPQLYDLTEMEQTAISSLTDFKSLYHKDYYPQGTYLLSNDSEWVARGFQLWDEEYQIGDWGGDNGTYRSLSDRWCCKNKIPIAPNTEYYFRHKALTTVRWTWYDKNENSIGTGTEYTGENSKIKSPSNAAYFTFGMLDGSTPLVNCMLNLWQPDTTKSPHNGNYEPYHDGGTVDLSTIKPNGIGDVQDIVNVVAGSVEKKWKKIIVDGENIEAIGEYTYSGHKGVYISNILDESQAVSTGIASNGYVFGQRGGDKEIWIGVNDKTIYIIGVLDDLGLANAAAYNEYLKTHPLEIVYRLKTPTTEHLSPQPITLQAGFNQLLQTDGSLTDTKADVNYNATKWTEQIDSSRRYAFMHEGEYSLISNQSSLQVDGTNDNLMDLDIMYGSDRPSTIAQFESMYEADFGTALPAKMPQTYEIVDFKGTGLKVTGKNIFDQEMEPGSVDSTTGELIPPSGQGSGIIRSKNLITVKPSTAYYGKIGDGSVGYINASYYDKNMNFIITRGAKNGIMTSPENAKFMRFRLDKTYGTVYHNDISIYESNTSINGQFIPYHATTIPLPSNMRSAGQARDEASLRTDTSKIGVVDLGDLTNWRYNSTYKVFYHSMDDMVGTGNISANILCPKYRYEVSQWTAKTNNAYGVQKGLSVPGVLDVVFRDDRFTDTASFKSAMQGVPLYYEKATPTTTELDNSLNYVAESGGLEEVVHEGGTSMVADIEYRA